MTGIITEAIGIKRKESMALSKFILDIGKKIEQRSGADITITHESTSPIEEWITEAQMYQMKSVVLRTTKQTQDENVVKLKQFNPSFFLKDRSEIPCRFPRCSSTTRRLQPTHSSQKIKQDLFLCKIHRTHLKHLVAMRCSKENVIANVESFKHEDFKGYTYLIGKLEKAFTSLIKKSSTLNKTDSLVAEVFLNSRNFLIITNALLSPDEEYTTTVLAPYMMMFEKFLTKLEDPKLMQNLLATLREVMNMILVYFGIMYKWVFLVNPGARIGAGLGLLFGFLSSLAYGLPLAMILASSVVGCFSGYLIGSGGYDWYREHYYMRLQQKFIANYQQPIFEPLQQRITHMPLYKIVASASGDLLLDVK